MSEELRGIPAEALKSPDEWEALFNNTWLSHDEWIERPWVTIVDRDRRWRHVETKRESRAFVTRVSLSGHRTVDCRNGHECGVSMTVWLPSDIDKVDLTIREVISGAPEEPDKRDAAWAKRLNEAELALCQERAAHEATKRELAEAKQYSTKMAVAHSVALTAIDATRDAIKAFDEEPNRG